MTQEQFEHYFFPMLPSLMRTARRLLGSHDEDAEDIVGEVMIKMWLKRKHLARMANPEGYCQKMVVNACLKLLKVGNNHAGLETVLDKIEERSLENEDNEREHLLVEMIRRLPPKASRILMLRIFEQREIADIAKMMHETETNVRQILSRSRRKIIEEAQNKLKLKRT